MGLEQRLNKDIKEIQRQKDLKNADTSDEIDLDEETYTYMNKKPAEFINEGHGVFDIKMQTGINTAKSVFNKGTLFDTSGGND